MTGDPSHETIADIWLHVVTQLGLSSADAAWSGPINKTSGIWVPTFVFKFNFAHEDDNELEFYQQLALIAIKAAFEKIWEDIEIQFLTPQRPGRFNTIVYVNEAP